MPDGDFFKALHQGKSSIVTDRIHEVTKKGINLVSGKELDADVIVTATGLVMQIGGGSALSIDGAPVDMSKQMLFRSMMISGVPNMGILIGQSNQVNWDGGTESDIVIAQECEEIFSECL